MAKIMIIEDNPVHKLLLCHSMEDLKHETMPFFDIDSAKEELKKEKPDLFIVDIQIQESKKSSLAFIRDLLKSRYYKKIPIIIISAYVTKEDIKDELPGFDLKNVIEKPFNVDTITSKVKELLKGKK
ncbi:MAG: response regulator [Candidatus Aminicenantes bacterium]|nr:MAG: response regulator [Candidatus Aminicenantes bacterium]